MSAVGRARAWIRGVVQRRRMEREMRDEMAAHLAQATVRFMRRGMSEPDARIAARREFGHLGAMEEAARDVRPGQWLDGVAGDLRFALRHYARAPLSSITIVLTLALGIGFSSAVFSVLSGIFSRPAPGVPDDPALVKIRGIATARPFARTLSYPELTAYAGLNDTFAAVAGWVSGGVVVDPVDHDRGSVIASAQFVTPNYFTTLGVRIATGRGFSQSRVEQLTPPELTAIVSDTFAVELFGDARRALGKDVKVNDVAVTIIGVAPPRFNGAVQSGELRRIWLPLSAWPLMLKVNAQVFTNPNARAFEALARLRPGVTVANALPAVRNIAALVDADANARVPRTWGATVDVVRLRGLIDPTRYANERGPVSIMFTVIAVLILLVCTTTVNALLVGAAVARRYEIGLRLALGASRTRIVRQLLTEIAALSIAGGGLGLWVFGALSRLTEIAGDGFDVSPNWATAGFTLAYAVLAATLAGSSPALHATRAGLSDVLKNSPTGAARKSRLQRAFVVAQIAIAQPLMVALAAVTTNLLNEIPKLGDVHLRERVMIADFDTRLSGSVAAPGTFGRLVRRITDLPGVVSVLPLGYTDYVSLEAAPTSGGVRDTTALRVYANSYAVPPGYFATLDVPMVRGRDFVVSDTLSTVTPVVINKAVAAQLFGSSNPIGRRVRRFPWDDRPPTDVEVVGVVDLPQQTNILEYASDTPPMFVPVRGRSEGRLLIRTSAPSEPLMQTVMAVAREEARMFPLTKIGTLAQADRMRRGNRLGAFRAMAGCATIVLTFAAIGLYAMMSTAVGQRRREIGIRVALGARARQVVVMFFAGGLRVTMLGLAIGLPLSLAGLAVITHVSGLSWVQVPFTAVLVAVAVLSIGSVASWLPARRAARVSPMVALRTE